MPRPGKQRYRALVDAGAPEEEAGADRPPGRDHGREPAPADAWRTSLDEAAEELGFPPEMETDPDDVEGAAEWQAELTRVQDGAAAILGALGDESAAQDLADVFDDLPAGARAAAFAALAKFEPGYVRPADAGELARWRADQSAGGRELVAHWGAEAPRKLGAAIESFDWARCLDERPGPQRVRLLVGGAAPARAPGHRVAPRRRSKAMILPDLRQVSPPRPPRKPVYSAAFLHLLALVEHHYRLHQPPPPPKPRPRHGYIVETARAPRRTPQEPQ